MRSLLKNRYLQAFIVLGLCSYFLGGCFIIGKRDVYESIYSEIELEGEYVPSIWYRANISEITFPYLRVFSYEIPHKVVIYHKDHSIKRSHKGFKEFTIKSLVIEYSDGTRDVLIDEESQESSRVYVVNNELSYIDDGIRKRMDFTLICNGVSITESGEERPFSRKHKYEYRERVWDIYTIFHEWYSI